MKFVLLLLFLLLFLKADEIKTIYPASQTQEASLRFEFYKNNYLLPLGYREDKYKSYLVEDQYINLEIEGQISVKMNIFNNLFGFDGKYYFAYTQRIFWQAYTYSSPFREIDHNPEIFTLFSLNKKDYKYFGLKAKSLKISYSHISNGQGSTEKVDEDIVKERDLENRSRSMNIIYAELLLQKDNFKTEFKIWTPNIEDKSKSDNLDLMDYFGYTSAKLIYSVDKTELSFMIRGNFATGYGAVELIGIKHYKGDINIYVKLFSGYGESLIDYNNNITKLSLGFSFF